MDPTRDKKGEAHRGVIERCRQGDRRAQFELYDLYSRAMYNTALRITGRVEEAEEVMQEAFLTAFEKLEDFRGEAGFGSWMKKIVINKALDVLRKRKVYFEELDEKVSVTEEAPAGEEDPPRWSVEQVRRALQNLPPGYRTILSLYLFEGYDHEEIAGILGISHVTSRTQYIRAKKKLKELLTSREDHGRT